MTTLYIVLGIVGYFALGSVITGILMRWCAMPEDVGMITAMTVFYPILIPVMLVFLMCSWIIEKISSGKERKQ